MGTSPTRPAHTRASVFIMSKSSLSTKHRLVDVDIFNPDNFTDNIVYDEGAAKAIMAQRDNEIKSALNTNNHFGAVEAALKGPPTNSNDAALKKKSFESVSRGLTGLKTSDINGYVKKLSTTQCDILLKYVYRGMADAEDEHTQTYLAWHGAVVEKEGLGCIMRVISDRCTV